MTMIAQSDDVQQRLSFIGRTISHAAQACRSDTTVSPELKDYIRQLGLQANEVIHAVNRRDASTARLNLSTLARLSYNAQRATGCNVNYDVKSAVILTHIEVNALMHQLA
jgi:hypothetical protein